jgi:hypothetical protein
VADVADVADAAGVADAADTAETTEGVGVEGAFLVVDEAFAAVALATSRSGPKGKRTA